MKNCTNVRKKLIMDRRLKVSPNPNLSSYSSTQLMDDPWFTVNVADAELEDRIRTGA